MFRTHMLRPGPRLAAVLLAAGLAASLVTHARAASEIIDSQFSTCANVGCDSTSIAGWLGRVGSRPLPWTAKFFAMQGNCLRMEVTATGKPTNLEMTVIAPNATTLYRDDDSASCTNCPVVKIGAAPHTGFYTTIVSTNNGASADVDFHLRFGQYPAGNANCTPATSKLP